MDQNALKKAAMELEPVLAKYALHDEEVAMYRSAISPVLQKAIQGQIADPMRRGSIPGQYLLNEGNVRQYKDLENAITEFKIQLTGGYTPDVLAALASIHSVRTAGASSSSQDE